MTNLVTLAQQLGEQLASTSLTRQFLHEKKLDNYSTIQLIPYKHLQDNVTSRYSVLRSLLGTKVKFYCGVIGNKHHIDLYLSIPKAFLQTLESSLYTSIGELDIHYVSNPSVSWLKYMIPTAEPLNSLLTDNDFKKDGQYIDPFMDVLNMFEQIDDNILHISCCIDFDTSVSRSKKVGGLFVKHMIDPLLGTELHKGPSNKWGAETSEHLHTKFALGYHLEKYEPILEQKVQSNFIKYLKLGNIRWSANYKPYTLQLNQVINFFHLPAGKIIHNLNYLPYRKLAFPHNIPTLSNNSDKNNLTIIGKTDYKSQSLSFGIHREDKLRHVYIIGKTGVGKSNLIANLARSDMVSNKGICVIDPHGDLIDDIIGQVPSYRINDVVLFDVSDREWPVGFNVLEYERPEEKSLIASSIVSIFKKLYDNSWGPRLEYILRNVILSILEYPNATLMHLVRVLTDKNFREEVLEYVKDPVILKFRRDEFDAWPDKQREEAISPISNKVGQFTSSQIIRNIFWQAKGKINFRKLMDEGKIILINLSKGKIGEDNTNLLGSFIVSKIQIDAMSRADIEESQRKDFYLYIDEFQNFATESFAAILSEARKYKLGLIVANQYSSQLDPLTKSAIFGNVGTIISMTLGYDDAVVMANQFKSMVLANDFLDIPKYKAYIKLMIHWVVSDPFSMQTIALPPGDDISSLKEKIRQQSRTRYAISRTELEELIKVRAERSFSKTEKAILKAKEKNNDKTPKEAASHQLPATSPEGEVLAVNSQKTKIDPTIKQLGQVEENKNKEDVGLLRRYSNDSNATRNDVEQKNSLQEKKPEARSQKPEALHPILPSNFDPSIFQKIIINWNQADQILRDAIKKDHKFIFHEMPEWLSSFVTLDKSKPKGKRYKKGKFKVYEVFVDMYAHNTLMSPDKAGIDIRVWTAEEVLQQIQNGFSNEEKRFLINKSQIANFQNTESKTELSVNSIDSAQAKSQETQPSESASPENDSQKNSEALKHWSIEALKEYKWIIIWKTYEGYVKLKYNYGLFVVVGEAEGLLHKKVIDCPDGINWKKLYEIGDPIIVKVEDIKEIDWRITIIWTQL